MTNTPTVAALINYFNDIDMLAWQYKSGFLNDYDSIYIWDGPYSYLKELPLFGGADYRLDSTDFGRELLSDPRVVYKYCEWTDECQKRIDAYSAIEEDVVVLHDADEFFDLNHDRLLQFWLGDYSVACHLIENIYAGGWASYDQNYNGLSLDGLARRWGIFKRSKIEPERHIDYLWIVGASQQPIQQSILDPSPFCHVHHLTGCRSRSGQIAKMSFYMSLGLAGSSPPSVINQLTEMVDSGRLSKEVARTIFLSGNVGFTGMPSPESRFKLKRKLKHDGIDNLLIDEIISRGNIQGAGTHNVLDNYPLYLWLPCDVMGGKGLSVVLPDSAKSIVKVWSWNLDQSPELVLDMQTDSSRIDIPVIDSDHLIGCMVMVRLYSEELETNLWQITVGLQNCL